MYFNTGLINKIMLSLPKLLLFRAQTLATWISKEVAGCDDPTSHGFKESPHLDVCFEYKHGDRVGVRIEANCTNRSTGRAMLCCSKAYLELHESWSDIPNWRAVATKLTESKFEFRRLGPSQLVKHVLGLKFGRRAQDIRLIYFYFDGPGRENTEHLNEIDRFGELVAADPIRFQPISIQEIHSQSKSGAGRIAF